MKRATFTYINEAKAFIKVYAIEAVIYEDATSGQYVVEYYKKEK